MKQKKSIIAALMIGCAFSIYSCKKDKTEDPVASLITTPATSTLTPEKTNVNQLEIVSLTSANVTLSQQTYTGTIGGQTVSIAVYQSALGFQIPELPAGTYSFHTTIEGVDFDINYTVIALAPIANTSVYIQTEIPKFTYTAAQLTTISSLTANMYGASFDAANTTIINNYVTDFQNKINAASPQALDSLAKFISANPDLFSINPDITMDLDTFNLNRTTQYADDLPNYIDLRINAMMKQAVKVCAAAVIAGMVGGPLVGPLFAGAIYVVGAKMIYRCNKDLIILLDKSIFQTSNLNLDDVRAVASTNTFVKDVEYTFDVSSSYRNLNQQDVGSSASIISNIISSLNNFGTVWNKMMSILPTSLTGTPYNINNVTSTQTKNFQTKPNCLTIKNISNYNVTATVDNSSGALKVTFNTTQTSDQSFTYDIEYTNPNVSSRNTNFFGTVVAPGTLLVGDIYQGGIIASILSDGEPGYIAGEVHGLIAAPNDQSTSAAWGCSAFNIIGGDFGLPGFVIGTGNQNTLYIIAECTSVGTAAQLCSDLVLNGYNDWYLPSKEELNILAWGTVAIGGFSNTYYWSSSWDNLDKAWQQDFGNSSNHFQRRDFRTTTAAIRAIRSF